MAQGGTGLVAVNGRSVYTLQQNGWTEHTYPEDLDDICFCSVPGGLFGMGGWKNGILSNRCHYFNGQTHQWEPKPNMKNARHSASAAVLGDEILVVGGEVDLEEKNGGEVDPEEKNKGEKFNFVDSDMVWQPLPSLVKPSMQQNQLLDAPMLKPLVASAAGILFVVPRAYHISPDTCMQQFTPGTDHFEKVRLPNELETDTENLPETERAKLQEPEDASRAETRYICSLRESTCACLVGLADMLYLIDGVQRLVFQYNPDTRGWTKILHNIPDTLRFDKGCSALAQSESSSNILVCGGNRQNPVRLGYCGVDVFKPQTPPQIGEWRQYTIDLPEPLDGTITLPFQFDWKNSYVFRM